MQRHFEQELDNLKTNLIRMGSLVDEQLSSACRSLFEGDVDLAHHVIQTDRRVDEFDTLIDVECQRILALTQPVAMDLRLLLAALGMNTQLERVGDIAANIAERAEALKPYREFVRSTRLIEMSQIARIMVKDSFDAFVHQDAAMATRVLESDDVVDNLDRDIFHFLIDAMKGNTSVIEPSAHIMMLSRHIERLADHATNIAEEVVFLVEARMVKHNAFGSQ